MKGDGNERERHLGPGPAAARPANAARAAAAGHSGTRNDLQGREREPNKLRELILQQEGRLNLTRESCLPRDRPLRSRPTWSGDERARAVIRRLDATAVTAGM